MAGKYIAAITSPVLDGSRALDHLLALLRIEGVSGQEARIAKEVQKRLLKAGCKPAWIRHDTAHKRIGRGFQVGNLIVRIPGKGTLRRKDRRLFVGHLDTVPLCRGAVPKIAGDRIVSEGNTALGADNRTAVGALITVVETILASDTPHPPLTFLFTVGEEIGLSGSGQVRMRDLGNPVMGFNVDGGSPEFLITGAIAGDQWQAHIYGQSAHAGVHPADGISATLIASRAIADVAERGFFGDVHMGSRYGTSNVGSFAGGEATNQVTDYVCITGESRSHSNRFLDKITSTYRQAFERAVRSVRSARGERGRVEFFCEREYDAFRLPANAEPVRRAWQAIEAFGHVPRIAITDGGLDANHLTAMGIPTVTLGAGQHRPHTVHEFVEIDEYLAGCQILTRLACT